MSDAAAKLHAFQDALATLRARHEELLHLTEPFRKVGSFMDEWKASYSTLSPVAIHHLRAIRLEEGLLDLDNRTKQLGLSKYSMQIARVYQQWKIAVDVALAAYNGLSEDDKKTFPLESVIVSAHR